MDDNTELLRRRRLAAQQRRAATPPTEAADDASGLTPDERRALMQAGQRAQVLAQQTRVVGRAAAQHAQTAGRRMWARTQAMNLRPWRRHMVGVAIGLWCACALGAWCARVPTPGADAVSTVDEVVPTSSPQASTPAAVHPSTNPGLSAAAPLPMDPSGETHAGNVRQATDDTQPPTAIRPATVSEPAQSTQPSRPARSTPGAAADPPARATREPSPARTRAATTPAPADPQQNDWRDDAHADMDAWEEAMRDAD